MTIERRYYSHHTMLLDCSLSIGNLDHNRFHSSDCLLFQSIFPLSIAFSLIIVSLEDKLSLILVDATEIFRLLSLEIYSSRSLKIQIQSLLLKKKQIQEPKSFVMIISSIFIVHIIIILFGLTSCLI
ncbi:hypothetical protein NH340_JMT03250 [Sarcoptes scabiei]|nr:hypothetical protein NH340_JMT03250 [Sarcoptes scabiei]